MKLSKKQIVVLIITVIIIVLFLGLNADTGTITTSYTDYEFVGGEQMLVDVGSIENIAYLTCFGKEIASKSYYFEEPKLYKQIAEYKYLAAAATLLIGLALFVVLHRK